MILPSNESLGRPQKHRFKLFYTFLIKYHRKFNKKKKIIAVNLRNFINPFQSSGPKSEPHKRHRKYFNKNLHLQWKPNVKSF